MHTTEPNLVLEVCLELGLFPVSQTLKPMDDSFGVSIFFQFRTKKGEEKSLLIKETEINDFLNNMDDVIRQALQSRAVPRKTTPSLASIREVQKSQIRAWLVKLLERAERELIYER